MKKFIKKYVSVIVGIITVCVFLITVFHGNTHIHADGKEHSECNLCFFMVNQCGTTCPVLIPEFYEPVPVYYTEHHDLVYNTGSIHSPYYPNAPPR